MSEQKICFVCGLGSTRQDWKQSFVTSLGPLVACDGHSADEVKASLARLKATLMPAPLPAPTAKAPQTAVAPPATGGVAPTTSTTPPQPSAPPTTPTQGT